jgi:hypothetical protein
MCTTTFRFPDLPPRGKKKCQPISICVTHIMNRVKALYRSWGILCGGQQVYAPRHRTEWLNKIGEGGVRRRAEFFYQQLDALRELRQAVRKDLLAESRKQSATKLLRQVPSIGPIRAALLIALIQTPHRFRTKRQLWTYSGLAIETRGSAQYRYVGGQLQRTKKPQQLRGLNQNHNHEMKEIFKSAANMASSREGAFHDFYQGLLTVPSLGDHPWRWRVGFFLRRSDRGRVSTQKLGDLCAPAPSLQADPMPPRMIQQSCRPRVSDRTMVGNSATQVSL